MIGRIVRSLSVGILSLSLWGGLPNPSLSQMGLNADNTLGSESTVINSAGNGTFHIEDGAIRGGNLFHSFEEFNIEEGTGVYFVLEDAAVSNIFSRVTSNDPSDILGTLGTCLAGGCNETKTDADLYLINPHGILFGRNAELDVGGSFIATTANAIEFGDQGTYSSNSPTEAPQLLSVKPSAFLFNESNTQTNNAIESYATLTVPESRSLLLVGGIATPSSDSTGNIVIREGRLRAPAGRIEIGGLSDFGIVGLASEEGYLELLFPEGVSRSDFVMTGESNGFAELDVTSGGGGDISIYARNISILGGSDICAGIGPTGSCGSQSTDFGSEESQAGDIVIDAQETITLSDPISIIENDVNPNSFGNAGNIEISGKLLSISDDGRISASTWGQGDTGDVIINAERVRLNDSNVTIAVYGVGRAGELRVYASDSIDLRGEILNDGNTVAPGGFLNQIEEGGRGSGGDLFVETNRLSISDGSKIQTTTFGDASGGRVGNVDIQTQEIQVLETTGENFFSTGIFGGVIVAPRNENISSGSSGGNVTIRTERLRISGGRVSAGTDGIGDSGNLLIRASDSVELVDNFDETGSFTFIQTGVGGGTTGEGGNLTIESGTIRLFGDSDILADDFAEEVSGGNITLIADSIVAFDDSDIFAFAQNGRGGNITLDTPAFFGENYRLSSQERDSDNLDFNDIVDINSIGTTPGIVTLPSTVFVENELVGLPEVLTDVDALVSNSCIVQQNNTSNTLDLNNADGLSITPSQSNMETYSIGGVSNISVSDSASVLQIDSVPVEPQGIRRLSDGRLLMSRRCS